MSAGNGLRSAWQRLGDVVVERGADGVDDNMSGLDAHNGVNVEAVDCQVANRALEREHQNRRGFAVESVQLRPPEGALRAHIRCPYFRELLGIRNDI